jgi:hypothetical protein
VACFGYVVRCHAGTLRLGDELTVAIDPKGVRHTIHGRCSSIHLSPSTPVDMLEANFGGQFILDGIDLNPVREGWTLRRDGVGR